MESWTQTELFGSDVVTDVAVRIGSVGSNHAQWQIDAIDHAGNLVANVSKHHFDLRTLESELRTVSLLVRDIIGARHSPFP